MVKMQGDSDQDGTFYDEGALQPGWKCLQLRGPQIRMKFLQLIINLCRQLLIVFKNGWPLSTIVNHCRQLSTTVGNNLPWSIIVDHCQPLSIIIYQPLSSIVNHNQPLRVAWNTRAWRVAVVRNNKRAHTALRRVATKNEHLTGCYKLQQQHAPTRLQRVAITNKHRTIRSWLR